MWRYFRRSQAISRIALVTDLAYESAAAPRFRALVVALLGLAALILVAGGIYALTLFNVLKRTREIGLRAALGAHPRTLIEGAVWMGLRPVALGIVVGLTAALPAVQVMQRVVKETLSANHLPLLVAVLAGLLASGALRADSRIACDAYFSDRCAARLNRALETQRLLP